MLKSREPSRESTSPDGRLPVVATGASAARISHCVGNVVTPGAARTTPPTVSTPAITPIAVRFQPAATITARHDRRAPLRVDYLAWHVVQAVEIISSAPIRPFLTRR